MRKSIFLFTEYFRGLDQGGLTGGTIALYEAVLALTETFDVTVFSFDHNPAPQMLGKLASRVVFLPGPKVGGLRLIADWNLRLRRAFQEAVATGGCPAAIIACSDTLPLLAFHETGRVKRIAVVQAYENFGAFCPSGSIVERMNGLKRSLKTRMRSKKAMQDADLVIVNSQFVDRALRAHFGVTRTKVIYPPLSRVFDTTMALSPPPPFTVGFVTRTSGKNLPFVMSLAETLPEAQFKVFGDLTTVPAHPPNVELMGWFPDRRDMYSRAAVWIVPSKWPEPLGLVAIEAQAAGQSVFVSNRGGLPETVPDPDQILPHFDKDLWADRIREAFAEPQIPDGTFLLQFRAAQIGDQWRTAIAEQIGD